jgi:Putative amidoligase enzyme
MQEATLKNFSIDDWSYGVELEYGNCYRFGALPAGAQWNDKDNTCVSSTGIANDPVGQLYAYGGEINTKPTYTIQEQIEHISEINAALDPAALVNYRSNLHIHIRVPGLKDDLESCKKLLRYIDRYQEEAFDIVETIPVPTKGSMTEDEYQGALKRMKRRKKSHQYKLPESRVAAMLAATTTQEFYEEHAPKTEKGRMWYFSPRAGINLRQMFEETNTIEFRHFPGTLNMVEMESAIRWCQLFMDAALNQEDVSPRDIYWANDFTFPDFQTYDYKTEQVYQYTNFDTNSRKEVKERLDNIRKHIDIDDIKNVTAAQVYEVIKTL